MPKKTFPEIEKEVLEQVSQLPREELEELIAQIQKMLEAKKTTKLSPKLKEANSSATKQASPWKINISPKLKSKNSFDKPKKIKMHYSKQELTLEDE
jgi:hypothetical protein